MLYGPGKLFLCRQCYRLPYGSQRESDLDRLSRKANKIRRRLGSPAGIMNEIGPKPKGMHRRTYDRLTETEADYSRAVMRMVSRRFGLGM